MLVHDSGGTSYSIVLQYCARGYTHANVFPARVAGILNDDDALDLFKKTLSLAQEQSSMGFLQQRSKEAVTARARASLERVVRTSI